LLFTKQTFDLRSAVTFFKKLGCFYADALIARAKKAFPLNIANLRPRNILQQTTHSKLRLCWNDITPNYVFDGLACCIRIMFSDLITCFQITLLFFIVYVFERKRFLA